MKVATLRGVGLELESTTASIWVGIVNGTGTPTYTASGLRLRLGLVWF